MSCAAGADRAPRHCPQQSPCCWALALDPAGLQRLGDGTRQQHWPRPTGTGCCDGLPANRLLSAVASPRFAEPQGWVDASQLTRLSPSIARPLLANHKDRGCGTAAGDPCVSPSLPAPPQTLAQPGRTFLRISTCPNLVPAAAPGWAQPAPAVPQPGTQTCPAGPMAPNLLTPHKPPAHAQHPPAEPPCGALALPRDTRSPNHAPYPAVAPGPSWGPARLGWAKLLPAPASSTEHMTAPQPEDNPAKAAAPTCSGTARHRGLQAGRHPLPLPVLPGGGGPTLARPTHPPSRTRTPRREQQGPPSTGAGASP